MSTTPVLREPAPLTNGRQKPWTFHLRDKSRHVLATIVFQAFVDGANSFIAVGLSHRSRHDHPMTKLGRKIALGRADRALADELLRRMLGHEVRAATPVDPFTCETCGPNLEICPRAIAFATPETVSSFIMGHPAATGLPGLQFGIVASIGDHLRHLGMRANDLTHDSVNSFVRGLGNFVKRYELTYEADVPTHPVNQLRLMQRKPLLAESELPLIGDGT